MKGHLTTKSGSWYAIHDVLDPASGKRRRKWHKLDGARGKREADEKWTAIKASMQAGTFISPDKTTLAVFLDRWLAHMKSQLSPRSHERYAEIATKNIAPLLGAVMLSKLRSAQISAAYTTALTNGRRDGAGGLSPRTVHHMHRVLKQALRQAVKWEELTRNPADAVDPPKVERQRLETYDMAQTAELLDGFRARG